VEAASITVHSLGQILVDQGLLSRPEVEDAIFEQELTGRRLGAILVEQGSISAADLAGALAEQYGIELMPGGAPARTTPGRRRHLRLVQPDELPENVVELPVRHDPDEELALAPVHVIREGRLAHLEALLGRAIASAARAERHLLFAPGPAGYTLVPRDGSPPAVGDTLELEGKPFTVAKLGRSPFPGDRRPCAFLERT
jgi:hypothetical protein